MGNRSNVYDDSELTDEEMLAAAGLQLDDPDGWGAIAIDAETEEAGDGTGVTAVKC